MSQLVNQSVTNRAPLHQRIMANLTVQATWTDAESGETMTVSGMTENLGETSALVNLEILPPVGSEVQLRIFDEENTIIEVPAHVIRVERDPSKMLASLSIMDNLKKWKQNALTAAQDWATRHWQLNYEEEWVN
jgi:PilZ domain